MLKSNQLSSDILKGLQQAGRYGDFFDAIGDAADDLLSDDGEAATFICEILRGDIPDVFEELPSAVASEAEGDFQALTSFVGGLPSIVPEVFSDIVRGGEVVVSIVEEIVTAPGEALTIIEGDAVSVWSDITAGVASVVDDVTYFLGCGLPWESCSSSSSFTDNGILSRCSSVLHDQSSSASSMTSATLTSSSSIGSVLTTSAATPGSSVETAGPSQTAVETVTNVLAANATSSSSLPVSTDSPPVNDAGKGGGDSKFAAVMLGFIFMFFL